MSTDATTPTAGAAGRKAAYTVPVYRAAIGKPTMTRSDKWKKRPCVLAYREWCDALRECFPNRPAALDVECWMVVAFYQMPASWSAKKKAQMYGQKKRSKPDADNIAKGVSDALWPNDHELGDLGGVERRWGDADCTIIYVWTDAAAARGEGREAADVAKGET